MQPPEVSKVLLCQFQASANLPLFTLESNLKIFGGNLNEQKKQFSDIRASRRRAF